MTEQSAFLELFGQITLLDVVVFALAVGFIWSQLKKLKTVYLEWYENRKSKDAKLQEALDTAQKYAEYHKQTMEKQEEMQRAIETLTETQSKFSDRMEAIEKDRNRFELNKLRDRLLQSYRYYTGPTRNPSQTWTAMESEAFWELFSDYEELGGDGYMHSIVQPAMQSLNIVDVSTIQTSTQFSKK